MLSGYRIATAGPSTPVAAVIVAQDGSIILDGKKRQRQKQPQILRLTTPTL
jgi:tRNA(Arg) A34 adenosine deaminase TadA